MTEVFANNSLGGTLKAPGKGSSHIDGSSIEWQQTGQDGFWIKPLMEDLEQGLRTWLMKVDPGAYSSPHSHDELEQVYIIEGSFYDDEKTYRQGEFVARAPGAMHCAGSEEGAVVMLFYSRVHLAK